MTWLEFVALTRHWRLDVVVNSHTTGSSVPQLPSPSAGVLDQVTKAWLSDATAVIPTLIVVADWVTSLRWTLTTPSNSTTTQRILITPAPADSLDTFTNCRLVAVARRPVRYDATGRLLLWRVWKTRNDFAVSTDEMDTVTVLLGPLMLVVPVWTDRPE